MFKKTPNYYLPLTFLFILMINLNGTSQIKKSDWSKYSSKKKQVTGKSLFNKLPENYSTWQISVSNFLNKMNKRVGIQQS